MAIFEFITRSPSSWYGSSADDNRYHWGKITLEIHQTLSRDFGGFSPQVLPRNPFRWDRFASSYFPVKPKKGMKIVLSPFRPDGFEPGLGNLPEDWHALDLSRTRHWGNWRRRKAQLAFDWSLLLRAKFFRRFSRLTLLSPGADPYREFSAARRRASPTALRHRINMSAAYSALTSRRRRAKR